MSKTKVYLLFETPYWQVYLGYCQRYLGRSIVKLKRECGDLAELTQAEVLDFFQVVKKMESTLTDTFDATMFNWSCLMNNAYLNNPPNPRVHWHFRPRYQNPVNFAGKTFVDDEFGQHYIRDEDSVDESPEVLENIYKKLKSALI